MYPDWPESDADLVPLPKCDGPKLQPFNFQGPQKIEFLDYIGEGLHAHVIKVKILGQIYALKLFRFVYEHDWISLADHLDHNREMMGAFYNYAEPFSCECRAFGRLQETGHGELAVNCFGYVLLDEAHEQAMMTRFSDLQLNFDGNIEFPGDGEERSRFLGKDGRAPPIRGIVKHFGLQHEEESLQAPIVRKMLRDTIKLQQLGILNIDMATRQIIDDRISDFSTAITIPHFITNPELNPRLTPEMISLMELATFKMCMCDYLQFDEMIWD